MTTLMEHTPIVVGGTAEEYWAGGEYHPTDLDLCPRPSPKDLVGFADVGLRKVGRHWVRDDLPVAVEFPGSGDDIERTVALKVAGVSVLMIGCEDLYLDRIRQATVNWPREDISFDAALEIAITNFPRMDWEYVRNRIKAAKDEEPKVGNLMAGASRRVRTRARRGYLNWSAGQSATIQPTGRVIINEDRRALEILGRFD